MIPRVILHQLGRFVKPKRLAYNIPDVMGIVPSRQMEKASSQQVGEDGGVNERY
jgi:hypothetical protein